MGAVDNHGRFEGVLGEHVTRSCDVSLRVVGAVCSLATRHRERPVSKQASKKEVGDYPDSLTAAPAKDDVAVLVALRLDHAGNALPRNKTNWPRECVWVVTEPVYRSGAQGENVRRSMCHTPAWRRYRRRESAPLP